MMRIDQLVAALLLIGALVCLLLALSSCATPATRDAYEGEEPFSDDSFQWVYETEPE